MKISHVILDKAAQLCQFMQKLNRRKSDNLMLLSPHLALSDRGHPSMPRTSEQQLQFRLLQLSKSRGRSIIRTPLQQSRGPLPAKKQHKISTNHLLAFLATIQTLQGVLILSLEVISKHQQMEASQLNRPTSQIDLAYQALTPSLLW